MIFALNNFKVRIEAKEINQKAICPLCLKSVSSYQPDNIAKILWKHDDFSICDLNNKMTEWKFEWLSLFPFNQQEHLIIDKKNNVKLSMNIKTSNKTYIQFIDYQIKHNFLTNRENFLEKLIWVFNKSALGIDTVELLDKKEMEKNFYKFVNPYGKIKTFDFSTFHGYISKIKKPLFIDLFNGLIHIKKIHIDNDYLKLDFSYNFIKVYCKKNIYKNIILEISRVPTLKFKNKYINPDN